MRKKKSDISKKVALGASVLALTASSAYFYLTAKTGESFSVPAYSVARVIDGDTFETTEKQLIRLASTEAPELEYCGGEEAKAALERLILHQPVYLKVLFRDPYSRLVSQVYTKNGYVNGKLITQGYAYYLNREKAIAAELKPLSDQARRAKKGIFGPPCTQLTNTMHPTCQIKGNRHEQDKVYFMPECSIYNNTQMQLYLGDQWFCTEKEALKAGYRKPALCP